MRRMKYAAIIVGVVVLVSVLIVLVTKSRADAHFFDGYSAAAPLDVEIRSDQDREDFRWVDFVFDGVRGHRVPSVMALPLDMDEPVPCVIFLHGIGQKKDFLEEIAKPFVDAGFAMVTFDQYTRGERDVELGWWEEASAFRERAALTVLETRRLVDYLETRNDIVDDRIYLVGASYGAITGATAVAMEPRIPAAVMVYGGGDIATLLNSDAANASFDGILGVVQGPLTALAAWYLAPSDPVLYVGDVAPRPLFFQNGTADQLIPTASAEAFFEAANEPKTQRWYEGDHVGLDEATTRRVLDDALAWIEEQDAARAESGKGVARPAA